MLSAGSASAISRITSVGGATIEHGKRSLVKQKAYATALLKALRERIAGGDQSALLGYKAAAVAAGVPPGKDGDYARAIGQVCSLIDCASCWAGWPMSATGMVRKPDGEINPGSFSGWWEPYRTEIERVLATHVWTVDQIDNILGVLARDLPDEAASSQWAGIERRGHELVRKKLHRKLMADG